MSVPFTEAKAMIVPVAEAKRQFSNLLKRAAYGGETVTIGSRGKPEAALISVAELARLRAMELEHDARLLEAAVRTSSRTVGLQDLLNTRGVADARPTRRGRRKSARSPRR